MLASAGDGPGEVAVDGGTFTIDRRADRMAAVSCRAVHAKGITVSQNPVTKPAATGSSVQKYLDQALAVLQRYGILPKQDAPRSW